MVQINFAQKQVNAKVVYYGPGMSGKTTNLEIVHQRAPSNNRGDLTSISTDGDRTLFFDFMPLDLGTVAGMRTCFQIYTVPGQVYYNSTRKLVLQGVDGVVFVADSSAAMLEENLESLRNLEQNLNEYGKSLANVPHVIQFNKRDLPDAMSVDDLNRLLNVHNAPFFEAIANSGQGVFPTLKALAARVLETIHSGSRPQANTPQPAAPIPMSAAPQQQTAYAQAPIASGKTGYYGAPVSSPAAVAAAQRALQQTGFHAGGQVQQGQPQRGGSMPPPLASPMQGGQGGAPGAPIPMQSIQASLPPMMAPLAQPSQMQQPMQAQHGQTGMQQAAHTGSMMGGGQQQTLHPNHPGMHQGVGMAQPSTPPAHSSGGLRLAPQQGSPHHGSQQHGSQPSGHSTTGSGTGAAKRSAAPARTPAKAESKAPTTPRPAPSPASTPQPRAGGKQKGMMYAAIFVVVALGIGAVVAKLVLKAF